MSDNPTEQVFDDLFRYLEVLETQNGAILQFLKDQGVITDEQFAPYLEKAATVSDVKWRAARVRMEHLFANVPEPKAKASESIEKEVPKNEQTKREAAEENQSKAQTTEGKDHVAPVESTRRQSETPATQPGENENAAKPDQVKVTADARSSANGATPKLAMKKNEVAGDTPPPSGEKVAASNDETQINDESKQGQKVAENITKKAINESQSQMGGDVAAQAGHPKTNSPEAKPEKDAA